MAAKTKTKWTPGTLRIVDLRHQKNGQIRLVIDEGIAGGDHIANVMAKRWRPETGTAASPDALAWANLLHAAPEMADAIREHLSIAEDMRRRGSMPSDEHDRRRWAATAKLEAALAKAEGR